MFRLDVLKIPSGMSEKKVINPTAAMVKSVIENVSLDSGVWHLKSPHRTRKKSDEKFRALRLDGPNGIRIRCKPAGNDTCYEYTLVPPVLCDTNRVFSLLLRVHPKNLRIPEGAGLVRAIFDAADKAPPIAIELPQKTEGNSKVSLVETQEEPPKEPLLGIGEPSEAKTDSQDEPALSSLEIAEELNNSSLEIAEELNNSIELINSENVYSLALDPTELSGMLLSDQFVLDRALLAISKVTDEFGVVKKHKASDSIVENLKIKDLVDSSSQYTTIAGAMRAIMMGLSKGRFIDRIGSVQSTIGYKLTQKGMDRINSLKELMSENKLSGPSAVVINENYLENPEDDIVSNIKNKVDLIQGLLKDHEHHESIKKEYGNVIEDLEKEKENINMTLTGLSVSMKEKAKQKEEIEKDIERLQNKENELIEEIRNRNSEIADWKKELEVHEKELARIKREIKSTIETAGD